MIKVKICGITNLDDALFAAASGADALGFIFHEGSPRYIRPEEAGSIIRQLPPFITAVGVFVDEELERVNSVISYIGLGAVQLHGRETPEYCGRVSARVIKTFRVKDRNDIRDLGNYDVSAFLLDTFKEGVPGGTGETFDWEVAIGAKGFGPVILSGGLTPENVAGAVARVMPYAVDVSSGVEQSPGKKDGPRVAAFIEEARSSDR